MLKVENKNTKTIKDGCKDCVKTIKKILKRNNIKIDYKNFDFDKYIQIAE